MNPFHTTEELSKMLGYSVNFYLDQGRWRLDTPHSSISWDFNYFRGMSDQKFLNNIIHDMHVHQERLLW